jgi:hypothetical protein
MNKYLSVATVILCLGLLALGVFAFQLSCQPNSPPPEPNGFQLPMVEVLARKEQLQQLEDHVNRIREAKRQMVRAVIAGQCRLAEAIDEFRKLDQPWLSASSQQKVLQGVGVSEYEWCGLNLIAFAKELRADHPDEAAALTGRLEKELQKLLAQRRKQHPREADPRLEPAH